MTTKISIRPAKRHAKVSLSKASASEILSAVKVSPAEERRAKSAVALAKRFVRRTSAPVNRITSKARIAAK